MFPAGEGARVELGWMRVILDVSISRRRGWESILMQKKCRDLDVKYSKSLF